MKVLHENYLEQMNEELEILNFKLDRMYEAAFSNDTSDYDNFSLLENVNGEDGELSIMNEEAYEMYMESLDQSLKKIWNAIKRFIKSIFTSSGETITSKDAKNIIEIISSAAADGDLQSSALKKVAQKGFYLIAGLGTSVDGDKLRAAYESGEVLRFVSQNINKINVGKIPEGARFRICIAHYDSSVKNSLAMIKYALEVLRDKGLAGIEAMGKNIKDTAKTVVKRASKALESYEDDDTNDLDEMLESLGIFMEKRETKSMLKGRNNALSYENDQLRDDKTKAQGHIAALAGENKRLSAENKASAQKIRENEYTIGNVTGKLERATKHIRDLTGLNETQAAEIAHLSNDIDKLTVALNGSKEEVAQLIAQLVEAERIRKDTIKIMEFGMQNSVRKALNSGRIQGAAVVGGGMALAFGIAAIVNKVKQKRANSPMNDHLAMATITYVNEDRPDAMAKVRLYGASGVTNIDIKGRDKVFALRDHLSELADRMSAEGDKFTPGVAESVREFATNINLFFAGLADRK